jgi:hypothetical protein
VSDFLGHSNPRRVLIPWGSARAYASSGTGLLVAGHGCITYNEAYETTGSASASVTVFDGTSSNGQQMIDYTLTESESTSEMWGMHWVQFTEGLYIVTNSGTVAGSITAWVDHDCAAYNGALYHMARLAQLELAFRLEQNGVTAILAPPGP